MDQQLAQTLFKMVLALAAVLTTFAGAIFIAKKFSGTSAGFLKKKTNGHAKPLEILAHQNLGPGRAMYLVRCMNKQILVGATNTSIQHLADVVEMEDVEASENFSKSLTEELNADSSMEKKFKGNLREIARV